MTCCICKREREKGKTVELTEEEKSVYRRAGIEPGDSLFYCTPCWNVISQHGPQILAGMYRRSLIEQGAPDPEKTSEAFYQKLVQKGKKR